MSLRRLFLSHFVIVASLELELSGGFTVLTGQTGAGKSILIDALQWVTGGRGDTGLIREGASRCEVAAEFTLPPKLRPWLDEAGFSADDDTVLLRRTLDTNGKGRSWINGTPATTGQLRALGEQLLDIHGQHAWQSLTKPDSVRRLLDAYAGQDADDLLPAWQAWRQALTRLQQARQEHDQQQAQLERLQWQLGDLDKLAPQNGEWEALQTEHARLANAQALLDAAQGALDRIQEDDACALAWLDQACTLLQKQEHIEPVFTGLAADLASSIAQIEEVAHSLRAYLRRTDLDPDRLQELDDRLSRWLGLARRFKVAPDELANLRTRWSEQLAALQAGMDLERLQAQADAAQAQYQAQAQALSRQRLQAAPRLSEAITAAMQRLGMAGGRFQVQVTPSDQPQASGLDDVGFLVAGHAGSTPRPIQKVASGGELSRIALAIAVTTSQLGQAETLIFDEVDSGVGGAVAETVGRMMQRLGQYRQVLAVTHLPQVAACAHTHWVVSKALQGEQTLSRVQTVSGEQRVLELARMLGGEQLRESTLLHARDMLAVMGATA